MKILVCVKQVPKEDDMTLDPVTRTLVRSQSTGVISEYDAYALELAVRIAEETNGTVTAITMGPPQAESVLRFCLSVGADECVLLSDRAMGGADAFATVSVLSAAKRYLEQQRGELFDLILCGQQASDSDTSLVMPELAEELGVCQISFVRDFQFSEGKLQLWRNTDLGEELLQVQFPIVVSVGKTPFEPRFPNIKRKLMANRTKIPVYDTQSLGLKAEAVGVNGSLTIVGDSCFPEANRNCVILEGKNIEELAKQLVPVLHKAAKG